MAQKQAFSLQDMLNLSHRLIDHPVEFFVDVGPPPAPGRLWGCIEIPGVHVVEAVRQDKHILFDRIDALAL